MTLPYDGLTPYDSATPYDVQGVQNVPPPPQSGLKLGVKDFMPASGPYAYTHLAGASTTVVATQAGILHEITVNAAAVSVTVYDNTAASGKQIAVIGTGTGTFTYDVNFTTGLTFVIVGASADVTVAFAS